MLSPKDTIIALPHGSLRTRSKKIGLVTDEVRKIIQDMKDATIDWEASRKNEAGVALAAVQTNILLRIVIVRNNCDDKTDTSFTTFINPEITKSEGPMELDYEGCLSIKNLYGHVPRYSKVRVKALDEDGREFKIKAEGFMARILQHEIDHTNGVVYIDHIKDVKDAFYTLTDDGKLEPLDYEKVSQDPILWQ
jgi:peptide deformylase